MKFHLSSPHGGNEPAADKEPGELVEIKAALESAEHLLSKRGGSPHTAEDLVPVADGWIFASLVRCFAAKSHFACFWCCLHKVLCSPSGESVS